MSNRELEGGKTSVATFRQENEHLKLGNLKLENDLKGKQDEITRLGDKVETLSQATSSLKEEIATLKESEPNMRKKYDDAVATLHGTQKRLEDERRQEQEKRHQEDIERITSLKNIWAKHQENVKERIKGICQKHTIEYVEKPPFKGNPDNTIKICDEYIVFDAKSPGTEDLTSFCKYVQSQTELVKKYAQQEGVKRDIFLVVPSNTIDVIERFSYNMGEYNVYVVAVDVLEPMILAMRKIEEYEFVEQLTPEERENICRIIGRFAHIAKRRIQIDHFFARQLLDILIKCESDIPSDLLQKAVEFEKAEKLNPPLDKRAKQLLNKDLTTDAGKIKREAEAKGLVFPEVIEEGIRLLPLYEEGEAEKKNQEGN
jgi:hypothetical protein